MERDLISVQPAALQEFVERDTQRSGHLTVWPSVSVGQARFRWEHTWDKDATLVAKRWQTDDEVFRGQGRTGAFTIPISPGAVHKYEIILWRYRRWHDVFHRRAYFMNSNIESAVWRGHVVLTIEALKQPAQAFIEEAALGVTAQELELKSRILKQRIDDVVGGDAGGKRRELEKRLEFERFEEELRREHGWRSLNERRGFETSMKLRLARALEVGELTEDDYKTLISELGQIVQRPPHKR